MPYQLDQPDAQWSLPEALHEISALTWTPPDTLWTLNDEQGILFCLSANDAQVLDTIHFYHDGDYEGIACTDTSIWITKSNGTLFEWQFANRHTKKHPTALNKSNDVEGLTYDPTHHRLLLACKERAGEGFDEFQRAIYAFDLLKKQLLPQPAYLIDQRAINAYLHQQAPSPWRDMLIDAFAKTNDALRFRPSALTIHPTTGDLWVISSPGKLLLVLSPDGKIRYIDRLDKKLLPQPEGITFSDDGTLFIASEGRHGPGKICRFNLQSTH